METHSEIVLRMPIVFIATDLPSRLVLEYNQSSSMVTSNCGFHEVTLDLTRILLLVAFVCI